eukprot:6737160-Prymnesium_polylepis.1
MAGSFLSAVAIRSNDAEALRSIPSQLTSSVRVVKQPGRGRCLETVASVEAGAIVLAEAPVCWWVDPECRESVCARCMQAFDSASVDAPRCGACGQVRWCCGRCKSEDTRHAAVCPLLSAAKALGGSPEELET